MWRWEGGRESCGEGGRELWRRRERAVEKERVSCGEGVRVVENEREL